MEIRIPTAEQTKMIICVDDSLGAAAGGVGAAGAGAVTSADIAVVANKERSATIVFIILIYDTSF